MLVEYQPLTPSSRALRPGAMIVLISVCPVFRSLPASGDFVSRRELDQRRDVGAEVRRGVRVRNAFVDRGIRVDHARRDRRIVLLEPALERRRSTDAPALSVM